MGNNTSGHHILRINDNGTVGEVMHIKGQYPNGIPQTISVEGNALDATIEIDDATIIINDRLHRVTVIGDNNAIVVNGADIRVRVEGAGNNISGSHLVSTKVYANADMAASDDGDLVKTDLFDSKGNVVKGAPPRLPLAVYSTSTLASMDVRSTMRCSYTLSANSGDNESSTSDESEDEDEKGDDSGDQNESSTLKRGPSGDSPDESDAKKPKKS